MFREEGKNAVILKHNIDAPFISHLEMRNEHLKFQRIDADLTEDFVETADENELKETADFSNRDLPQSPEQRQARRKGGENQEREYLLYGDALRGKPQNAGYDENVQHERS